MNDGSWSRSSRIAFVVALVLVFGGGLLASLVQTGGGRVSVRDIRFVGSGGSVMSALLFVPPGVSAEHPAPGVLAIHGYINARETQSGYAIELARRGYVVLELDQTGHGYSDPPALARGFGGPDGLAYLRSLDIVDPERIALEGHSMGGWAVLIAAGVYPDGYRSVVVSGSSTGTYGAPDGTPAWPRNFGLVFSRYDEFSQLMWGAAVPADIVNTEKLQTVFGTDQPVEPGRLYGSVADGSARMLYQPAVTHPGDHITRAGIGAAVDWIQRTVAAPNPIPSNQQVWMWKELGTALALVGMFLFLFSFSDLLLASPAFRGLHGRPAAAAGMRGASWWVGALILVAVPVLTYFWLQHRTNAWFPASAIFPQTVTTGIAGWAVGNGIIALALFVVWLTVLGGRRGGADGARLGLSWAPGGSRSARLFKTLLFALTVLAGAYLLLALSGWLFTTDFRFWVVAVKLMAPLHLRIALSYFLPFLFFFLVLGLVLHGQLRGRDGSLAGAMVRNMLLMGLGFVVLLLVQYLPLLSGGTLANAAEPLLTIVAIQFVVLLPLVGLLSTYLFRRTGSIYAGAFVNAGLITWIVVASQATHFAL